MSSAKRTTRTDLSASLALPTSGHIVFGVPEKDLSSSCKVEGKINPKLNRELNKRVPVLDKEMRPLMPTTAAGAKRLLKRGQASAYWNKLGIFCIILKKTVVPNNQPLALGIDPGSSFEGWSVVGAKATVLNGTSTTPKHVKGAVEQRRVMRRSRRGRTCRRRQCRSNRNVNKVTLPPSTFARWNAKVRILTQLSKIIPISDVAVEDVAARTKKGNNIGWNQRFSPIEQGKQWFYEQIQNKGLNLVTYKGTETKKYRDWYRLNKSKNKGEKSFSAHAVDAWVLAATLVGAFQPTDKSLYYWTAIVNSKRALHRAIPQKSGIRTRYGGTRCLGLTKGTLVTYRKKLQYVSGVFKERLSLTSLLTGKRTTQSAKLSNVKVLTRIAFRTEVINKHGGRASSTS
jgi:hypothetical protein